MNAERWHRVRTLFDEVVQRPPDERLTYLRTRCEGDAELLAEVEPLLSADANSEALFEEGPWQRLSPSDLASLEVECEVRSRVFAPGDQFGPYTIHAHIGSGGMGEVYRAHDPKLQRLVAIKVLSPALAGNRERLARFEREARALAALKHPHIGAIYGWQEDGQVRGLVLELIDGVTLADRLAGGSLRLPQALSIAAQIASALRVAHDHGIVHRDLKPQNVLIDADGVVKVVDFGLSGALHPHNLTTAPTSLTAPGVWLGTVTYMSPEQARGWPLDSGTDLWSLGCVLFEMLTGRPPFRGGTVSDIIAAILERSPDWSQLPANTPGTVRRVLERALEKDSARRWQSAGDVQIELEDALRAIGDPTAAAARDVPRERTTRGWGWPVVAVATVSAIAIGLPAALPRLTPSAELPEMRLQVTTPHSWELASFAISPDGRQIVFQGTVDGKTLLWRRPMHSDRAEPLAGTDDAYFPFWSPDNQSIGFFADYQMKRIDLATGVVRTIANTPHARGATWNGSGTILYASSSGPLLQISDNGGVPLPVSDLGDGHLNHRFPQFLPDGRQFLFVAVGTPESSGIYLGSLGQRGYRRVLSDATNGSFLPPNYVLFARGGILWAQAITDAFATQGEPRLVANRLLTHPDVAAHRAYSASLSGTIAYRPAAGEHQLVWLDRTGRPVGTVGLPDPGQPGYIRLSPDGRTVALRRTSGGNTDVWVTDVSRGVPQRITVTPAIDWAAEFSPDGRRLVYASDRHSGIDDLYEHDVLRGTDTLLLASHEQKVPLDWSPDGRYILYAVQSVTTGFDLWVMPLEGDRKPIAIVRTPFEDGDTKYGAAFSPDGRWIAYQSNRSGRYEIYLQPFPAGPARAVQLSITGGFSPQWRGDGRELFFVGENNRIMAVSLKFVGADVQVEVPRELFTMPTDAEYAEYAVSPDGNRFLVSRLVTPPSPITILLNWRPTATPP